MTGISVPSCRIFGDVNAFPSRLVVSLATGLVPASSCRFWATGQVPVSSHHFCGERKTFQSRPVLTGKFLTFLTGIPVQSDGNLSIS